MQDVHTWLRIPNVLSGVVCSPLSSSSLGKNLALCGLQASMVDGVGDEIYLPFHMDMLSWIISLNPMFHNPFSGRAWYAKSRGSYHCSRIVKPHYLLGLSFIAARCVCVCGGGGYEIMLWFLLVLPQFHSFVLGIPLTHFILFSLLCKLKSLGAWGRCLFFFYQSDLVSNQHYLWLAGAVWCDSMVWSVCYSKGVSFTITW